MNESVTQMGDGLVSLGLFQNLTHEDFDMKDMRGHEGLGLAAACGGRLIGVRASR